MSIEPEVTTERVGVVAWRLAQGVQMTTYDVAEWTGLTHSGAWYLLTRLSRVLPIVLIDKHWQCVNGGVLESERRQEL